MGSSRTQLSTTATQLFGNGNNAMPTYRFVVLLNGVVTALFTEVTLPTLTVETEDVKEGGQNTYTHHLPVRVDVGKFTLKRGITDQLEFLNWYQMVLDGDIVNAKQQVTIIFLAVTGMPVIVWNFRDAYPTRWTGPQLSSSGNSIAIEEIELVHHGFEFEAV